jgi:hypothetical protein
MSHFGPELVIMDIICHFRLCNRMVSELYEHAEGGNTQLGRTALCHISEGTAVSVTLSC